jgi:hypothetical protein
MAEKMLYNKIIDLLEHDKPVFSTGAVPNGSPRCANRHSALASVAGSREAPRTDGQR